VAPISLAQVAEQEVKLHGTALIDRSHGGRFDVRPWNDTSIGGLTLNLLRDGFFPRVTHEFPERELTSADLLFAIAPQRPYSQRERELLQQFMQRGGRVIVSVGSEELDGARSLLADAGLDVLAQPLAYFRTGPGKDDLVFTEGWGLQCPPAAQVLVRQWGIPVVARVAAGAGSLSLIGDSSFFLDKNLEDQKKWFPGNIAFLEVLERNRPIPTLDGKYGDPRQPEALADTPTLAPAAEPAGAMPEAAEPAGALPRVVEPAPAASPAAPQGSHP
jgi:hypothetical protein